MFRVFRFEQKKTSVIETIPWSMQFKLEQMGISLSLEQWLQLTAQERWVLCHLPVRSRGERRCFRQYLEFLLKRMGKEPSSSLSLKDKTDSKQWENLGEVPPAVCRAAARTGETLTIDAWIAMDDIERYVLFCTASKGKDEIFSAALREFRNSSSLRCRGDFQTFPENRK